MENKQEILNHLCSALQNTRAAYDLETLTYVEDSDDRQRVVAKFKGGTVEVNVTWDSGIAMIRDVIKGLDL